MAVSSFVSVLVLVIMELVIHRENFFPLVPAYTDHFESLSMALNVYHLLVGLIGAAFGGASVIFEIESWSFFKQGVIHFMLTTAVWLPISTFLWGLSMYPSAIVSIFISFAVTYGVTWWMNYQKCRESIQKINEKLAMMQEVEDESTKGRESGKTI